MKVFEKFVVPIDKLNEFISSHIGETVIIKKVTSTEAHFFIKQDYTHSELQMFHLRKFIESGDARPEEQDAAEYAISAIKTLIDMGVIK